MGFRRRNGEWSCQHLIGRSLLAKDDSTIPKNELQGLTAGANLQWVVRQALSDWVCSSIVAGDSEVALCWVTTENKPLAIFQRNRAIQVRRSLELTDLYHVRTEANPSDVGTRPGRVTLSDIGPGSRWEEGDAWMKLEFSESVDKGIIKPASCLRVRDEEESEYRKGLVFEKVPEILTRGHVIDEMRVGKIEERANFSKYLILPTKFNFVQVVRITSFVMMFAAKCRRGRKILSVLLTEGKLWFSVFTAHMGDASDQPVGGKVLGMVVNGQSQGTDSISQDRIMQLMEHLTRDMYVDQKKQFMAMQVDAINIVPTDRFLNMALLYLYRKAAGEVKHFCTRERIEKIAIEVEGVLLSKGRLLDGLNYSQTGELTGLSLGDLGVKTHLPLIERYSPLAYSVADHIHWDLAKHKGVETCSRMSLEVVSIMQGHSLFKEMAMDCMLCKQKRKRFLEVEMGPVSGSQLQLAPPFWMCQVDLFGPITVVVPGFERETRNRKVLEAKCWVMTVVCPTTRLVNLQVMESSKAAGWLDAFTRLACEVGCPSHVFCDRDSAGMSAFNIAEVEVRDLQLRLHRDKGITFSLCPVAGHDRHGHVERVIRSVQESFEDCGLKKKILHATGLQTVCKLVENQYNNLPLGYHYARDADNSPLLKIITPNMLRVGKVNRRAIDGPIRMPKDRLEILARVNESYDSWFKVWAETMVPKLMFQPKWYKTSEELKEDDLVYFPRTESALDKKWILGAVNGIERGRDGLIRIVDIRYKNRGVGPFEITSRSIRRVVKLWSIEDISLSDDLAELTRKFQDKQEIVDEPEEADGPDLVVDEQGGLQAGDREPEADDDQLESMIQPVQNNDILLQLDEMTGEEHDPIQQQLGDDPNQQPGGELHEPQAEPQDGGPAKNTRSRCAKCCCSAHHSISSHLRQSQLGKEPTTACDTEVHRLLNLFPTKAEVEANVNTNLDTIDGILEAVDCNVLLQ